MIASLHLKTLFWIGVVIWGLTLLIEGQPLTESLFHPASIVLFVLVSVVTIFEKLVWRWRLLYPWFVSRPNVIGTYKGELRSEWVNPAMGQGVPPITAYLSIHQTLSTIQVRLFTAESASGSLLGDFIRSPDGVQELLFSYRNEPRSGVRDRSPMHYGGAKVLVDQTMTKLTGSYWTDRKTKGEMEFVRISRRHCHNFGECSGIAP